MATQTINLNDNDLLKGGAGDDKGGAGADGIPLEVTLAPGKQANELLLTISTEEPIGIDRVAIGLQGLPAGVSVIPAKGAESTGTIFDDFVGVFGETETFTLVLPADADMFSELRITAEGYLGKTLLTGTTVGSVKIDYDVEIREDSLSVKFEDQSIWGDDADAAIEWHQYIPIVGGEAVEWKNDAWVKATDDAYWRSGSVELIDFHVSTAETVDAALNAAWKKFDLITGVTDAWTDYNLDVVAYNLAKVAYDAAEVADNGLEVAYDSALSAYNSALSNYNSAVSNKNTQYNQMMATAYDVRGLFGEYWFTAYNPIEAAEYAAAKVYLDTVAYPAFQIAGAAKNTAWWALDQSNRYVVDPLYKTMVNTKNEMNASYALALKLENDMHKQGYYTEVSYSADPTLLVKFAPAVVVATAEYAAAQLAATVDFSADLEMTAEVGAWLGLQIDCELDSGTADSEVDYKLTTRTQYNQTTDVLTITPQMTNQTTGESIAFTTQTPNIKFSAALLYGAEADLEVLIDGQLSALDDAVEFDVSPNGEPIRIPISVSLDDLKTQEIDVDADGQTDAILDLESGALDIGMDGTTDMTLPVPGIDIGKLTLVEFDSSTDLDVIEVPFIDSLTQGIASVELKIPYIETKGTTTTENPEDFYDEGQFVTVDFSEISSTLFNMLDARIDFSDEFMDKYGVSSLTDEQSLQSTFASVANGFISLILDQIDGQSEGVPIFVIDTTDTTDTSLVHLNLAADPTVDADTGSFGFYAAYGESDPIVKCTIDLDQLVAVIVNHIVLGVVTGGAYQAAEAVTNLPVINPLNQTVDLETILKMAYIDGATADAITSFLDFGYSFEMADFDVSSSVNLGQKFALSIDDMKYVITLEDNETYVFQANDQDSLSIPDASSHDTNNDGIVSYSLQITPEVLFSNDTELGFGLGYQVDFLKGSLAANLKLPLGSLGEISLPGIDMELGPLLRVEGEIDTLDIDVFESRFAVDVGPQIYAGSVDIDVVGVTASTGIV